MTNRSSTISRTLSAGETDEWLVPTQTDDAVRVSIGGDGQPYDVDVTTASFHPAPGDYGSNNYTSTLPGGAVTVEDTSEHTLATAAIEASVAVVVTNNSGSALTVTGSVATLGRGSAQTIPGFVVDGTDTRAVAYLDGELVANVGQFTQAPLVDTTVTFAGGGTQTVATGAAGDTVLEATAVPATDPGNDHGYTVDAIYWDDTAGEQVVRVSETESAGGGDARVVVRERGV